MGVVCARGLLFSAHSLLPLAFNKFEPLAGDCAWVGGVNETVRLWWLSVLSFPSSSHSLFWQGKMSDLQALKESFAKFTQEMAERITLVIFIPAKAIFPTSTRQGMINPAPLFSDFPP